MAFVCVKCKKQPSFSEVTLQRQLSGLLGIHREEYLPFMIYAEARQPCYSISLLQLFQAYCTLPSIFAQHILWRKRTKLDSQKADYHKQNILYSEHQGQLQKTVLILQKSAVKVRLGCTCHETEDSWWETSQQLKLNMIMVQYLAWTQPWLKMKSVLQKDNHTEGTGGHNQQSVILGSLYSLSRCTSHHRPLWSKLGNLSSDRGSCYICKLCCWPQELNTGKSWYHHPHGTYWLQDLKDSFGEGGGESWAGGGLLSHPLLPTFSCLDGG